MFGFLRKRFFFSFKTFEKKVADSAMEINEQMINEMGAEVHDDLIQKLSVFRLYIDRLERAYKDSNEVLLLASKMNAEYKSLNDSVRRISRRLMPVNFETDTFQSSIVILCQNMERPGTANIHLELTEASLGIGQRTAHFLLRIIQELIHNAQRHSSAWHIWVRVATNDDKLLIEVEDDGTSLSSQSNPNEILTVKRNSLRMRALSIGATISYQLGNNKGLMARIVLPL
jgi:signal transduction histidine kinase